MSKGFRDNVNRELDELYEKTRELRTQVEKRYQEALEWKAKRDNLNKGMSQLASRLREEREHRNSLNEKVAELKILKEGFNKELEEAKDAISQLDAKRKRLIMSLSERPDLVREKMRELEWFLQTNVLSLSRENEIVKEISTLEKKLQKSKEIDDLDANIARAVDRAREIRSKLNEYRTQMLEPVKLSQQFHAKVIDLVKQIAALKKEADGAHEKYVEAFNSASELFSEFRKTRERIREIDENTTFEKTKKKDEITRDREQRLQNAANQAFEKVKKGNKLTIDELSLLVDKGFFNEETKKP